VIVGRAGGSRPKVRLREVLTPDDPAIGRAYRLLRSSLHSDELVAVDDWRHSLAERVADLWTDMAWHLFVAERGGRIVGMGSGTYLGNVNIGFVGYLGVASDTRGERVGTRLRDRLRAAFKRDATRVRGRGLEAILGEVRIDNPWLAHLIKSPRILALDFVYHQPRLHPHQHPVPLVLYYEAMRGTVPRLPARLVRRLLYTIWRRAYRIDRPLRRPILREILDSLAKRRWIGELSWPPPARAGLGNL
jgi:hypothetical protein